VADLPQLLLLEQASFSGDRLSARSFRRWLRAQPAALSVATSAQAPQALLGYALLLMPARSGAARLYSLAVSAAARGAGVGAQLLAACCEQARAAGRSELRLEVSVHNRAAIRLYLRAGFRLYGRRHGYYEDGADALCLCRFL
jgi:ribosomal protein S18 acetylase RimI-like enzyme